MVKKGGEGNDMTVNFKKSATCIVDVNKTIWASFWFSQPQKVAHHQLQQDVVTIYFTGD